MPAVVAIISTQRAAHSQREPEQLKPDRSITMTSAEAPIEIVAYDPSWPVQFQTETDVLRRALAPWLVGAIEHIAVGGIMSRRG